MKKKLFNFYKQNKKLVNIFSILLLFFLGFLYVWNDQIKLICYLDESVGKKVNSKKSSNEKIVYFYKYQKKVIVFDVNGEKKFTNLEEMRGRQVIKSIGVGYDDNTLRWGINQFFDNGASGNSYIETNEVNRATGYLTQNISGNKSTAEFVWSCSEKKKLF
jgi:hypothetical protein